MATRQRFLPVEEAQIGMVLASQANAVRGGMRSFSLPQNHILTAENLEQLRKHQVEYLFVQTPDTRPAEQVALDAAQSARRVMALFDQADLTDPDMVALFDQVLQFRSA